MIAAPKQQANLVGSIEFAPAEKKLSATLDRELSGATKAKIRSAPSEATQTGNNPLKVNGHNFYRADPSVVISEDGRLFLVPITDNRD